MKKIYPHLWYRAILVCSFVFLTTQMASAQAFTFTNSNKTYSENFNSLGSDGTALPTGWTAFNAANAAALTATIVTNGSASSGALYNVGATDAGERALGTLSSGSTQPFFGAAFENNTGETITDIAFSGVVEQWRSGSRDDINEVVVFEYSINATGVNDETATWTALTGMDLVEILTSSTAAAAQDGNAVANQANISANATGIGIADGNTFYIRWTDSDDTGSDGIYAIDDLGITVTTSDITVPVLDVDPTSLADFGEIANGSTSSEASYTISGTDLSENLTVTAPDNFQVSKTTGSGFASSITFTATEVNDGDQTVFVVFAPTSTINGVKSGNIVHSTGVTSVNVAVSGTETGNVPAPKMLPYTEDFNSCPDFPVDWLAFSVVGDDQVWECTDFGFSPEERTAGLRMSGFDEGAQDNEDWLISPPIGLTSDAALSLQVERRFEGINPEIRISSDYSGSGDPSSATWTTVSTITFPAEAEENDQWNLVEGSLGVTTSDNYFIAIVYTSNSDGGSTRLTIDDFTVTGTNDPTTSISDELSAQIQLVPNPSNGTVKLTALQGRYEVEVVDILGKVVYTASAVNETTLTLNAKAGLYFVKVAKDGEVGVKRLVIK